MSPGRLMGRWQPHFDQTEWGQCSLLIQLWDSHLEGPPLDRPRLVLEREGPPAQWLQVSKKAVPSPSGLLVWFGLEHRRSALAAPPVRYRISVESPLYVPAYRETRDFELTQIHPYDSNNPAPPPPETPLRVLLHPSTAYPFEPHLPVIRGSVKNADGEPVPDARVEQKTQKGGRVLTDPAGQFALPLKQVRAGSTTTLEARDRHGRTASLQVSLPQSLASAVHITLR